MTESITVFHSRFSVRVSNVSFNAVTDKELEVWLHLVGVYYGLGDGEGVAFYRDGVLAERRTDPSVNSPPSLPGTGRLVLGRKRSEMNGKYASLEIDEILIFNRKISQQEIEMIFNGYK